MYMYKFSLAILVLVVSCGLSEEEARNRCKISHAGSYVLDTTRTERALLATDSVGTKGLIIIFNTDSTFYTNMRVAFLDDTCGFWDAGTCGFESSGKLYFKHSPHIISFAPCHEGDSTCMILGKNISTSTSSNYWFKRI